MIKVVTQVYLTRTRNFSIAAAVAEQVAGKDANAKAAVLHGSLRFRA